MRQQLTEFFSSSLRNTWLADESMKVYVRKGMHVGTDRKAHRYLDIANVEVKEELRHQGHFKDFLALCQEIQPYDGIIIENVLDDFLRMYLRHLVKENSRWTERDYDFLWENWNAWQNISSSNWLGRSRH